MQFRHLRRMKLQMYDFEVRRCAPQLCGVEKEVYPNRLTGAGIQRRGVSVFPNWRGWSALETELFVDDSRIKGRAKLRPDPAKKALFVQELDQAERLADTALRRSGVDPNALFVKSLASGLRADNAGLIEKQSLAALGYTKDGRVYAERLLQADPRASDAYLGPGVENYMLSLKPAPLRILLRITGANVDREKGLEELRKTASGGHYLEPFAKLLLAVAAMRDNNPTRARELLGELHTRFPDNELYMRELDRIRSLAPTRHYTYYPSNRRMQWHLPS